MAIVIANRDGTSSGKAGDTVVTGGGLVHIGLDGTKTVEPLPGVGKTKSYDTLQEIANALTKPTWLGGSNSGSGGGGMGKGTTSSGQTGEVIQSTETANGLQEAVSIDGYNPNLYAQGYESTSSAGASKIVGAVILGLLGIAVLDRFVSGKGK